jgi:excinuclease ABC subunit C
MALDPTSIDLPRKPGVYLFRRADERVTYVGKATDLRSRVKSYFVPNPDRKMVPRLVEDSDRVDFIVTKSPSDALILERQLIREHEPRYNSMLKDDKSYPFIALTDHEHPRIIYTRHPPEDSLRWGPFADPGAAKRVIQLLRRHFGIRDCPELLPQGCLAMHIGLCHGPCIDATGYDERIAAAIGVLDGDAGVLIESLQKDMDASSLALEYEAAARTRDLIGAVQRTVSQRVVHSRFYQDCDAIGFASRGDNGMVVVLNAKDGIVQGQLEYPLIHRGDIADSVACVLAEHYSSTKPPRTVLVPAPIGESMVAWLVERRAGAVEVRVPQRGELALLRGMADQNAEVQVEHHQKRRSGSLEQAAADDAARLLGLDTLDHIVCFDMAQLQGDERVGASVVLRNGRPAKKEYRTYRVKSDAPDDLRMMSEVVERWLKHQDGWPDLLLLDGGETHLSSILRMLDGHGLAGRFPVAALAKREETLHMDGREAQILSKHGRVLVHARDEAHRFVNRYHRKRRGKGAIGDPLEEIGGLGAKKIQALLRHFGGRRGIEHASVRELREVPGIGKAMAERVHGHLNN